MAEQTFQSLNDLFMAELMDIYDAELQITEALPKMISAAHSPELKQKFETHLKETQGQVRRLEEVFSKLGAKAEREPCVGMQGLIKEGEKIIQAQGNPDVRDAGLIAAAQKVEHYEISSYGTLRTFARTLGHVEVGQLLQQTLQEESYTDELLNKAAMSSINRKAA